VRDAPAKASPGKRPSQLEFLVEIQSPVCANRSSKVPVANSASSLSLIDLNDAANSLFSVPIVLLC
jgi:hypothetical protein